MNQDASSCHAVQGILIQWRVNPNLSYMNDCVRSNANIQSFKCKLQPQKWTIAHRSWELFIYRTLLRGEWLEKQEKREGNKLLQISKLILHTQFFFNKFIVTQKCPWQRKRKIFLKHANFIKVDSLYSCWLHMVLQNSLFLEKF